jgi:hypothetical protein
MNYSIYHGFKFSDANHDITANEYNQMMQEMATQLNALYSTTTITVNLDDSSEGGFEICDTRWPRDAYKGCRHNFQQQCLRQGYPPRFYIEDYTNDLRRDYNHTVDYSGDTVLRCFRHEITFSEKYGPFATPAVWVKLSELQKQKKLSALAKTNRSELKKMRHETVLKTSSDSPQWNNAELNIIKNVFIAHGIQVSKGPRLAH